MAPLGQNIGQGAVPLPAVTISQAHGEPLLAERSLAVEVPVNIVYSSVPFAVMMATPGDLEDFAYGFSRTEGVIEAPGDIRAVAVQAEAQGLRLDVTLAPRRLHAHLVRRRSLSGRTGCGLCGIEELADLPCNEATGGPAPRLRLAAIHAALAGLQGMQPLNQLARAVHAAAWAGPDGSLQLVREDVGRHNALDKLIGAMLRQGMAPADGFLLITSRCSFEMVEKAAAFGLRSIVAISAPTALAVERARALDMTLVAVARADAVTVFHGAERILPDLPAPRAGDDTPGRPAASDGRAPDDAVPGLRGALTTAVAAIGVEPAHYPAGP